VALLAWPVGFYAAMSGYTAVEAAVTPILWASPILLIFGVLLMVMGRPGHRVSNPPNSQGLAKRREDDATK
jgi:hypothetical protein